uniref:Uncharacterized protein n=1 Tax=Anopheles culicifacies TaxID=139723 RepID=A0A182LY05_9DIPT
KAHSKPTDIRGRCNRSANEDLRYYVIEVDSLASMAQLQNGAHYVYRNIRTIFFYPKWMFKKYHSRPTSTIVAAFQSGYEVVYDLDNTLEIFHWNNYSRQMITIDPQNIVVPDETHDLYGAELLLYLNDHLRKAMPFETYFLEQVAERINATAVVTEAVFESGIYDYYYNNVTQINLHYVYDTFVDRVVKVSDLTLLWYAYACGILLSLVCFLIESVFSSQLEKI